MDIQKILKPETRLEKRIISDESFILGCNYGKPRSGHPEGKIIFHIRDVLDNIDEYSTNDNRHDLRLVGFIHDTMKYQVDTNKPKTGKNHHARIARRFAEKYINENRVLKTIELHDEAYNSWYRGNKTNDWTEAEERAKKLIKKLGRDIDFYLEFYNCDNLTGDKSRVNYNWFVNIVNNA